MGQTVDLNSDLGEGYGSWTMGDDACILRHVTSANIACGFHAGDPHTMLSTVRGAHRCAVAVGAHPGYPDLAGFGRRAMACSPDDVYAFCLYQIGALAAVCRAEGIALCHVKPHGALYNQSAFDRQLAAAIAQSTRDAAPDLILLGLAGTEHETAARDAGVRFASEVFADRTYMPDGSLMPRCCEGAILHDPAMIATRVVQMVTDGTVEIARGARIGVQADSVCLHGDNPAACAIAESVRTALDRAGVSVRPLWDVLNR